MTSRWLRADRYLIPAGGQAEFLDDGDVEFLPRRILGLGDGAVDHR
jgi:hypothetical protein